MTKLRSIFALVVLCIGCARAGAQSPPVAIAAPTIERTLARPDEWFATDEGRRICDNIVSWQNPNGGWWKFYDPTIPRPPDLPPPNAAHAPAGDAEDVWRRTSTFDNGATYSEVRILARAHRVTGERSYRDAFDRGLKFIFDAQYDNGGWPQRFPLEDNYGRHITFNDNAMTNVMRLLRDAAGDHKDFAFVSPGQRARCKTAFERGIDCILRCQISAGGKLTAWCQQHDEKTFAPTLARSYELPSICAGESSDIVVLLMELPGPDDRVRRAVDSAVAWYRSATITGKRLETVTGPQYEGGRDKLLIDDASAPPLWARFYDIETNRPFVCDRDGIKRESLKDLSWERRVKYAWYGYWGDRVLKAYEKWEPCRAQSNVSIQAMIDAAPQGGTAPHVIVIKRGVYKGRIVIPANKPFLTLRGEDPDPAKTVLTNDWNASYVIPGTTQPVGTSGTASTTIEATNFTAENITFENSAGDKGQAVAVKSLGDRAVFRNCRFLGWQDTLYPDAGRQYFDRCYIEGRVDFIFGGATAVFDRCTIHSKNGGYITAARTFPEQEFGFVFLDCALTGDDVPTYLGRPWQWDRGRKASVHFIRTKMGPHIRPEGWNQWDRPNNPNTNPAATARYFEFGSTDPEGKPIDVSERVSWSHQLAREEAEKITLQRVLGGQDNWNPANR